MRPSACCRTGLVGTANCLLEKSAAPACAVAGDGTTHHDFLSRFFAPWMGILEDPVTGSAHTVLAPYWAERLGRRVLRARQCSARGGELRVAVDAAKGRVEVAGQAVIVLKGELLLPEDAY